MFFIPGQWYSKRNLYIFPRLNKMNIHVAYELIVQFILLRGVYIIIYNIIPCNYTDPDYAVLRKKNQNINTTCALLINLITQPFPNAKR